MKKYRGRNIEEEIEGIEGIRNLLSEKEIEGDRYRGEQHEQAGAVTQQLGIR